MKTVTCLALLICFSAICCPVLGQGPATAFDTQTKAAAFIENNGQWDSRIEFVAKAPGSNLIVMKDALCFDIFKSETVQSPDYNGERNNLLTLKTGSVIRLRFDNSNGLRPAGRPGERLRNYFYGNDPSGWVKNVREYQNLKSTEIYKNIDIALKFDQGSPRFDFIVNPGADPRDIRISCQGASGLKTTGGQIEFTTSAGLVRLSKLYAYQVVNGLERKIDCQFVNTGGTITFDLGNYDRSKPLVIDPVIFSAYTGGGDADEVKGAKTDSENNLVVAGWTLSEDFPTTPGAYSTTLKGGKDVFISKYRLMGTDKKCLFTTFIGGSNDDIANGLDIDTEGNIYVGGETNSDNYPVKSAVYQIINGKRDILLSKISKSGDSLCYSTYVGGSKDDYAMAIAVGESGSAYLTGGTYSENFPSVTEYNIEKNKGMEDVFIIKVSTAGTLLSFSTLMTTAGLDRGNAIAVDENQMALIVGGETNNARFYTYPNSWQNVVFDRYQNGGYDGFIAKFGTTGGKCDFSGYFGGALDDRIKAVFLEPNGNIFIAGETSSTKAKVSVKAEQTDFPLTSSTLYTTNHGGTEGFYAEFGKKGDILNTSSFFGGKGNDEIIALGFNTKRGSLYMIGTTTSTDFPTINDPASAKYKGKKDIFISEFNQMGTQLLFSTLIGASDDDLASSLAIDTEGDIYVAGSTASKNFPVYSDNSSSQFSGGATDGFLIKYSMNNITFMAPKKGGEYCTGTKLIISWDVVGFSTETQYAIDISSDAGQTWSSLANNATGGEYNWMIPGNFPTADYLLRICTKTGLVSKAEGTISILGAPKVESVELMNTGGMPCEGDSVALKVTAISKYPKYQWKLNGTAIKDATAPVLVLPKLKSSDAGSYTVVVSGKCQPDAVSQAVVLDIKPQTNITSEPQDVDAKKGKEVKITVASAGAGLSYEWFKDGSKMISNAEPVLTIASCTKNDEGLYKCVVNGDCGSDTSREARLTVDTATSVNGSDYNITYCGITRETFGPTEINLNVASESYSVSKISLYNFAGSVVGEFDRQMSQGDNSINIVLPESLSSGVYWLVLHNGPNTCYRKFVVAK